MEQIIRKFTQGKKTDLMVIFKTLDKKKKDKLTPKKFLECLEKFKIKFITKEKVKKIMPYIDMDEDGYIDREQFEDVMEYQFYEMEGLRY